MLSKLTSDRVRWLLLGIAAIVLVIHSLAYNFVTDDAYISFVYSRNLAEHGQLSFNLGQPVEGYTNFLWTVVLGLLIVVGISPELSSRVLGTACALATLYVVFRVMERALGRKTPWAVVPSLLLACSSGFACWTSGGLETQLFTLLCVVAIDGLVAAENVEVADRPAVDAPNGTAAGAAGTAIRRHPLRRAAIALALAAMTRPEGLLVAAVIGAVRLACNVLARRTHETRARCGIVALFARLVGRTELVAAAWFLGIWAPWFAWRWWYYGYPFPNTYYVKAHGPWANPAMAHEMWKLGGYYLWVWLEQTHLIWVLPIALAGLGWVKPRTPRFALALVCAVLAAVYLPYAASVGGDFMGLHRFIMPMFVVAAIAVVLGCERIAALLPRPREAGIAIAVVLVGAFAFTQVELTRKSLRWGNFAADEGVIDTPAFLIVYTEDRAAIGRAMEACFKPDDFSIVGGAGAQPYYGRMRGIDVFGLVSDRVAHEEPRIRARAGHTKFASDKLLAEYDPTFVFSCYTIHPTPASPPLPCNVGFWMHKGYEQVTMHIPGMKQSGEYYTFLAKKSRNFDCPGLVH